MSSKVELKLDWCSHQAAKYAVEHWHYSRRMPVFKNNFIGVWEDGKFVGVVIFGLGAARSTNGNRYGMAIRFDIAELTRVALSDSHKTPVSRILKIACKMIANKNPNLKALISFADTRQGHHGGIYQAAGWIYADDYDSSGDTYIVNGVEVHAKTLHTRYGKGGQSIPWLRQNVDPKAERVKRPPKHRYLLPLTEEARKQIEPFRLPYPKRATSIVSDAANVQFAEGSASLTVAL